MKKTALLLIILTIISKTIGFGREMILSYFYGASNISDAYLIALTIPETIFAFIGTGIGTGYIPLYSNIEKDQGTLIADKFTNNIINLMLVISIFVVISGFFFVEPLVKLFAFGFQGETYELTVQFTKISLIGVFISSLTYIFSAYLQLKNNFYAPALMGIPLNLIIIASIVISFKSNVLILIIGTLVASLSQTVFLLIFMLKKNFKYYPFLDLKNENIKKLMFLAIPIIIGVSVNQINVLFDRTIASQISIGGISALNYANRLNLFIQGIFVMSIATAIYPRISEMASENNIKGLKKSILESINAISIFIVPITIGIMIFSREIVTILFGRGAFGEDAITLTSSALFFYSIGMLGFGLREILSRAFYSVQNTKTPMINAAIGMVLNIILNIILSRYLGIGGLALATSIAALFTTGTMFLSLVRKVGSFGLKKIIFLFFKILFSSLIMGLVSKLSYIGLMVLLNPSFSLIIAITIGIISYLTLIYFMKIEEVDIIAKLIKEKLKNN